MNGCIHFTMNNCTNFSVIHGVTILPYRKDLTTRQNVLNIFLKSFFFSFSSADTYGSRRIGAEFKNYSCLLKYTRVNHNDVNVD